MRPSLTKMVASVIGFGARSPAKVLDLLSQSVAAEKVSDINSVRSQTIGFSLLQEPYRTFCSGNTVASNELIVYCLPSSASEYIGFGSESNTVRSAILSSSAVVVVYDVKDDSFAGGSIDDILAALANDIGKKESLASGAMQALSSLDLLAARQIAGSKKQSDTVIVVGSGGREHALAVALARSPLVGKVICCPGNGGTAAEGGKISNADVSGKQDNATVMALTKRVNAQMVVVGPEQPLVDGIVDEMQVACPDVRVFGPSKAAAELEASKAFTKDFLQEHGIPTAKYKNFTDVAEAIAYVESLDENDRQVVKASGLAAGKGVLIPTTKAETVEAVKEIMSDKSFGSAGDTCVIESFMTGPEASCFALCDGKTAVMMPAAQDHKRALDNDAGLNTGGMGAYAPAPVVTPSIQKEVEAMCITTVEKMAERGTPYVGLLYAGIMCTPNGPSMLEYNCRFGDPETQVVLPLLETDLYEVFIACCDGTLGDVDIRFKENISAATVVCAASGYPEKYPKGMEITGLDDAGAVGGVKVYHAGTKLDESAVTRCSGGRVLAVTGMGSSLKDALRVSYDAVEKLNFVGSDNKSLMHHRTDIGKKATHKKLRIGVLGSTRGTALLPVIEACASGTLHAEIVAVVSNKKDALILEKGRSLGVTVTTKFISSKGLSRSQYDAECTAALANSGAKFVILVGYMRILSQQFCDYWAGRCINVHPSLLPKHAGGMDLAVHQAAIDARDGESGCTIHQVTEEVDGGAIVVQKLVKIVEGETAESLKSKVQPLEGPAFVEALQKYCGKEVISYADAGVSIDAGNQLVEVIKPACKSTIRPGCDADLGGFGGLFDLAAAGFDSANTVLIGATDGVGTKLRIAQATKKHDWVGIDLVAMCVNDLIVAGGEPLFFLDYYATGRLEIEEAAAVVRGIAEGCRQSGCGLIGGETAEMPSMYAPGDYDLAGFSVGAVDRNRILPAGVGPGDILLGLSSSGIHSNGFSLVRKLIEKEKLTFMSPCPWDDAETIADSLLTPTKIYVKACLPLLKAGFLNGMAHITGGGLLENLPRSLPKGVVAEITGHPALPSVFKWMQQASGLEDDGMLTTFNCGIGMVLIVKADKVDETKELLRKAGEIPCDLGRLVSGEGEQVVMKCSLQ
mmetsp:Transcript_19441/g.28653  ORF Transcript_19441/g.28653 Transcript_19441/m.28653 type:complete len:1139 (-) Transcript_19441:492-3908(-)